MTQQHRYLMWAVFLGVLALLFPLGAMWSDRHHLSPGLSALFELAACGLALYAVLNWKLWRSTHRSEGRSDSE